MDMKNKVLIISNMYPSPRYPHYGVFVKKTVQVLTENGYKADVIFLEKQDNKFAKLLYYVKFYFIALCKIIFSKYDVIYAHYASHTSIPVLLGTLVNKKIKLVVNVHGNDVVWEDRHDEKFAKLVNLLLEKADKIICPSTYFEQVVVDNFSICPEKTCVYPSGGVDTDFFCSIPSEKAREKLKLSNNYKYIGYVSRIEKDKGWDLFLEMAYQVHSIRKDIRFIVVGDGFEISEYNKKVKELALDNEIIKYPLLSRVDLKLIYNALDIFIFPTYRKSESLGLVGLEAMACEDLVILPNKYGPTSYAEDMKNSIVFESANATDLIEKTLFALEVNPSTLKEEARKTAERFNNLNTDRILVNVFEEVLN